MRRAAAIVALALAGCATPPTQLVVVVDTNLEVPAELDSVDLIVTAPDGIQTVAPQSLVGAGAPTFPLTLGVSPSGTALGPINVAAAGKLGDVEVVRQTARGLTLIEGETRVLHLLLVRSCVGRTCTDGRTCGVDGCANPDVSVEDLDAWSGEPPPFDTSDPCIAMSWDVDGDGHGDAACGGDDCDDTEPLAHAGQLEECDGIDNDCDGMTDEDCDCAPIDAVEGCPTACGTTGERTCGPMGWGACQTPDEVCNGIDDDCDGTTDEGFAYAATSIVHVTDEPSASQEPHLIWAGDRYALVWEDDLDGTGIHFATLGPDGRAIAAPHRVSDQGRLPSVAFGDGVYAVVWWDRDSTTDCCDPTICDTMCTTSLDRIYLRILDGSGNPRMDPVRIESNSELEPRPRVVWDGSAFAIGWHDGDLYMRRYGTDGSPLGPVVAAAMTNDERADMVWTGTAYAFAMSRADRVYFTQGSDTAGFPAAGSMIATTRRPGWATLAWTGEGFLTAWGAEQLSPRIEMAVLDPTGAVTGPMTVLSASARGVGFLGAPSPVGIAAGPGHVLVTWPDERDTDDGGIYAARFSPTGAVLQDATRISDFPGNGSWTTAAWGDDRFGVAWEEDTPTGRDDIYFTGFACP